MEAVINGGKVVVVDGCEGLCAAKKLQSLCMTPHIHIIATEEGIEKHGMADPTFEEIETLIAQYAGHYSNNTAECGISWKSRTGNLVKK